MSISVDIDTGGTFTDAFVSDGSVAELIKVETTPHDLTVCFLKVFEEAASRFGMSEREFLARTDVVRYSTTVGTNMLIERRGPRLGLLVAEGEEERLYANGDGAAILSAGFISPEMVRSVRIEGTNGDRRLESDELAVRETVAELLDAGISGLVIAMPGSHRDPTIELAVRSIVRNAYPRYLLGAVPVLMASEVSAVGDDNRRLTTALLNAYLHPTMVRYLYRAEELIRERGYRRPLLVVHSSGGATRVAKTMAIETWNSGPVSGLHGAKTKAQQDGEKTVITMDIGGTSTDIGLVLDGRVSSPTGAVIENIPVAIEACEIRAIGGGGGSIAAVDEDGNLTVGPRSAGALPGPASYDLGGTEATVTDANLVLGLLSAEGFFAGGRSLNVEAAEAAIERSVAGPLGIDVLEAARQIRQKLESFIAESILGYAATRGVEVSDAVLLSFGGAGGLHAAAVAERVGIKKVYCYREAPVFSAYGVATMDVVHRYEASVSADDDAAAMGETLAALVGEARRDMNGEGFDADAVALSAAVLDPINGTVEALPGAGLEGADIAAAIGRLDLEGAAVIELRARASLERDLSSLHTGGLPSDEEAAPASRQVTVQGPAASVPVRDWRGTPAGERVSGPALIDAAFTTAWVPDGWGFARDESDAIVLQGGGSK